MLFLPTLQTATYADPSDAETQARSTLIQTVVLDVAPGTTSWSRSSGEPLRPWIRASPCSACDQWPNKWA